MERIQTAHLYTTVSLVFWAMLQSHCGYDVCDRLRVDNLHKSGEGAVKEGIYNMRVMKSSGICELVSQYDAVRQLHLSHTKKTDVCHSIICVLCGRKKKSQFNSSDVAYYRH